jgi:hypothetical protein
LPASNTLQGMYPILIYCHSAIRWLLLAALGTAIYRAYRGYTSGYVFSKGDNALRHWAATIAHIQLVLGILLYTQSPVVKYFMQHRGEAGEVREATYFGIVHIALMLVAIVVITIGSALAKRQGTDKEQYRTMLLWYAIALLIIFIAIPWPFSPLAQRPYFR